MGFELTTLVVIGTDCTGSCKFNYHAITTMTAPKSNRMSRSVVFCGSSGFLNQKKITTTI